MKFCNCRRILDIYSQGLLIVFLRVRQDIFTQEDYHYLNACLLICQVAVFAGDIIINHY